VAGESHRPPRSERCRRPFVLRRRYNSSPCTWYSLSYFDRVRFSAGATLLHAFEVNAGAIPRVTNTADDERVMSQEVGRTDVQASPASGPSTGHVIAGAAHAWRGH
jgi:hypothetical protein